VGLCGQKEKRRKKLLSQLPRHRGMSAGEAKTQFLGLMCKQPLYEYIWCPGLHPPRFFLCVALCMCLYLCLGLCLYFSLSVCVCLSGLCQCQLQMSDANRSKVWVGVCAGGLAVVAAKNRFPSSVCVTISVCCLLTLSPLLSLSLPACLCMMCRR